MIIHSTRSLFYINYVHPREGEGKYEITLSSNIEGLANLREMSSAVNYININPKIQFVQ